MRVRPRGLVLVLLVASCSVGTNGGPRGAGPEATTVPDSTASASVAFGATDADAEPAPAAAVRLAFVGDVMLGRGVAPVAAGDPGSVFERLRPALVGADLAFANLESPLTTRDHLVGENALEADPSAAALLAGAGFDVLSVANNHATDAGPETVLDSIATLDQVGLVAVGGGATDEEAAAPAIVEVEGLRIGVVAFDLAGGGPARSALPGVNAWDPDRARALVAGLDDVDVVVASVHGGVEYLVRPDPGLLRVTGLLAEWGADVVWGHGAHVVWPVEVGEGAAAVIAPGLGNALFDQPWPRTRVGMLLEVLVGANEDGAGPIAFRTGRISIDAGRAAFDGWDEPAGDAVAFDGDWWTPMRDPELRAQSDLAVELPSTHEIVARAAGDVTGTGQVDLVVSYRRLVTPEPAHEAFPEVEWVDPDGRTAHLAVRTDTGDLRWGSAIMFQPVGSLAVCDGALALGFTELDDGRTVAGGAWMWDGFGFRTAAVLPGTATPGCADVDGDGRAEPVLVDRVPGGIDDRQPIATGEE